MRNSKIAMRKLQFSAMERGNFKAERVGRKSLEMQERAKSLLARCYIKALGLSPVSMVKPKILSRE